MSTSARRSAGFELEVEVEVDLGRPPPDLALVEKALQAFVLLGREDDRRRARRGATSSASARGRPTSGSLGPAEVDRVRSPSPARPRSAAGRPSGELVEPIERRPSEA